MVGSEVLRLKEAADYVRVSEKTFREMAKTSRVPCQRVGREWRFLRKALDEWLTGTEPTGSRVPVVSESLGQLYLPTIRGAERPARNGFGDTAFTKNREEPIHSWVPWIAGFSASFVGEILDRELGRASKLTVLDPFAGVGTALVEGIRRQCGVLGFEINPYAALACQVKLEALYHHPAVIRQAAERIDSELRRHLRGGEGKPNSHPPQGFHTRDPFFSPRVEQKILFAKDFIAEEKKDWLRRLICLALGAVMVGVSNYTYEPSLGRRAAVGKDAIADAEQYGFEIQELHRVRKKRTGSSIINSSVRVGTAKEKVELYETAVELRTGSALKRTSTQQ